MKPGPDANSAYLALGIAHLRQGMGYVKRGRRAFFHDGDPDTFLLAEGELRKALESLIRLGQSFWRANPGLPRDRIGEMRQRLTHDYAEVDRLAVWQFFAQEARPLLQGLNRAKLPKLADADTKRG